MAKEFINIGNRIFNMEHISYVELKALPAISNGDECGVRIYLHGVSFENSVYFKEEEADVLRRFFKSISLNITPQKSEEQKGGNE